MATKPKPKGLPASLTAFVHEYDSNGGNGTAAWLAVHPKCSVHAAAVQASLALKNPEVRKILEPLRAARFARLAMKGDKALALVSMTADVDLSAVLDEKGAFLPFKLWPSNIRRCVKSFEMGEGGVPVKVKFYDALAAQRIILEQTGKLKNPLSGLGSELARLLAPDAE